MPVSHPCFIKALNFWSFKYSPLCQELSDLFLTEPFRADEQQEDAEGLGMGVIPFQRIPGTTQKQTFAVPSNWGPPYDCITPKTGVEICLFIFVWNATSVPAVSIRAASGQKRHWAVWSYKVLFQCHIRAQTGADCGALKRPQCWALKVSLT